MENQTLPVQNDNLTLTDIVRPLYNVKGWLRLIGVLAIISGIMQCLTCIGLLYGWLPIWMGILLMGTATAIEQAHDTQNVAQIVVAQQKLALYIKIFGVLMLLGMLLTVVVVLLMLTAPVVLQSLLERLPELQQRWR